jgi:hypothetical protein
MGTTPPVPPNEHAEGVFEWLGHDAAPGEKPHPDGSHPLERVTPVHTHAHARLDPLTVQGVINRVLVLVFCLIAVGAAYATVRALSSSRAPQTTSVTPSLVTSTTAPHAKVAAGGPKRTTTVPKTAPATTPTVTAATVPVTTPPATTPRATTPRPTSPPATFPRPVVAVTSPPTSPQTIQVPATSPTTSPTGPSDTVVVPFK